MATHCTTLIDTAITALALWSALAMWSCQVYVMKTEIWSCLMPCECYSAEYNLLHFHY